MKHIVHYVPHTHYDAEVFLTRDETFEIGYSILIGALSEMRKNSEFKFAIDQTCYIAPFLRAYPEHRSTFLEMVANGRLEITCGMYAMPDVNIPSGESFIRQVLLAKRWCKQELGVDVRCGWLLDTFGQHPQIPQLMIKCGFGHNLFQRLGTIDSPTEFWWQGLDGTKLFCHWMRGSYAILYGAPGTVERFRKFALSRLRELIKHADTQHLLAVSGADLTHIEPHVSELFKQYNSAYDDIEFRISTPKEYFDIIKGLATYPVTVGDKNPVFQGCYSARIAVKQWNRRLEILLGNAELANSLCLACGRNSSQKELIAAWEPTLFNQFHDIICGSHVDKVYANVIDRYKVAADITSRNLNESFDFLSAQINTLSDDPRSVPIIVFNSLAWTRTDTVECSVAFTATDVQSIEVVDSSGQQMHFDILSAERYGSGGINRCRILFIAQSVPSAGYMVFRVQPAAVQTADAEREAAAETTLSSNQPDFLMADNHRDIIENEFFSLEIDAWNGAIRSLYDKTTDWEFIPAHQPFGGTVVRELDNGNFWEYNGHCKGDALTPMNRAHPLPEETDGRAAFSHHYGGDGRVINGRARTEYNVNFAFGTGYFSTRVRIYNGIPRIDIHTTLLNREERVRYRMAMPTTLHGASITHEIPFGAIQRPEGEFAAQNWMDCSDSARGLAILNRGLPGNCVHDNVMMLALLKCTSLSEGYGEVGGFNKSTRTSGGYEIDVQHAFDYSLLPHIGDWRDARLVQRGMEFNNPLIAVKAAPHDGTLPAARSMISVSASNVIVTACKAAEDGGSIVVRLYECCGWASSRVLLRTAFEHAGVSSTNLIEQEATPITGKQITDEGILFDIGPFEIKTFLFAIKPNEP